MVIDAAVEVRSTSGPVTLQKSSPNFRHISGSYMCAAPVPTRGMILTEAASNPDPLTRTCRRRRTRWMQCYLNLSAVRLGTSGNVFRDKVAARLKRSMARGNSSAEIGAAQAITHQFDDRPAS